MNYNLKEPFQENTNNNNDRYKNDPRYIPAKARKAKIENERNEQVRQMMEGEGPFGHLVVGILDWIFDSLFDMGNGLLKLCKDSFDLVAIDKKIEIFPTNGYTDEKYYISYGYLRYFVTLATPPVGVFMAKGLSGWFNILITIMFCYVNYFLGIIYAFLLTYNSKYAKAYANKQEQIRKEAEGISETTDTNTPTNKATIIFFVLMGFIFIFTLFYLIVYVL
tara:strand:- start:1458 stop:2120 length:663 start_codon:yes stop_codon:yes gene_type:complete